MQYLKKIAPLIVFVGVFLLIQSWPRIRLWIDPVDTHGVTPADVTIYTTSWCPWCKRTRQYLQDADIPYTELDIEKSASAHAAYTRLSGRGVPVITVDGEVIQGYDPARIRQAVEQLRQRRQPVPETRH